MLKDIKEMWDGLNTLGKIVVVLGTIFLFWLVIVTLKVAITHKPEDPRAEFMRYKNHQNWK